MNRTKLEMVYDTGGRKMNKAGTIKMRVGLTVAMLVPAVSVGTTAAEVTADSNSWEGFYECDQTPVAAGWINNYGFDDVAAVVNDPRDPNNNYISVVNWDGYEGFRLYGKAPLDPNGWNPNTNGGISIEIRMRAITGDFFFHLWPSAVGSSRWLSTYISPTSVIIQDSDDGENAVTAALDPNDTDFHIYRITCDDTDCKLYRYKETPDPNYSVWLTATVVGSYGPSTNYQLRPVWDTICSRVRSRLRPLDGPGSFPPQAADCLRRARHRI